MRYKTVCIALFLCLTSSSLKSAEWIYEIQRGDNLWNLSRQFLIDINLWPKLQSLNGIKQPRRLQPGTKIRVPMEWLKIVPGSASVLNLFGNVTAIGMAQKSRKLAKGDLLPTGTVIQTDASSNITLRFDDGSIFLLKSNGQVKLKNLKVYPGTGMVDTRLEQKKGKSESKVKPKKGPGSRFEIKTPSAVAGVRGTAFRVETLPNGEVTDSEVIEGEVAVAAGGATQTIPKGFGTSAKAGGQPLPPVELLPAPNLTQVPSTFERDPFYFRFPHKTGAISYLLEIAPNQKFTHLLYEQEYPSTTIKVSGLPDGKYVLRIRAMDRHGLEGFDAYHPFTVNVHPPPPELLQPLPASQIFAHQPIFRWRPVETSFGYHLQLASDFHFRHPLINESHLQAISHIAGFLRPGKYYWRVAAIDSHGKRGPFSPAREFIRLPPPPDMDIINTNGVPSALQWQAPYEDARYRLQIAWDRGFEMVIADILLDKPEYFLPPLKHGDYFIRVKTYDAQWEGPYSQPLLLKVPGRS